MPLLGHWTGRHYKPAADLQPITTIEAPQDTANIMLVTSTVDGHPPSTVNLRFALQDRRCALRASFLVS
jgi:hypothetical protein